MSVEHFTLYVTLPPPPPGNLIVVQRDVKTKTDRQNSVRQRWDVYRKGEGIVDQLTCNNSRSGPRVCALCKVSLTSPIVHCVVPINWTSISDYRNLHFSLSTFSQLLTRNQVSTVILLNVQISKYSSIPRIHFSKVNLYKFYTVCYVRIFDNINRCLSFHNETWPHVFPNK